MATETKAPSPPQTQPQRPFARILAAFERHFGEPKSYLDNPFLLRGIRMQRRGSTLIVSVLIPPLLSLIAYLLIFRLCGPSSARQASGALGLTFGQLLALVSVSVYGYSVSAIVSTLNETNLHVESTKSTLEHLLMLPMRRSELLLKMSALPILTGILTMSTSLPFLLLAHYCGGLTWLELCSVYVLFVLLCFSPLKAQSLERSALTPTTPQQDRKQQAAFIRWILFMSLSQAIAQPWVRRMHWLAGKAMAILQAMAGTLSFYISPSSSWVLLLGWPLLAGLVLVHPIPFFSTAMPVGVFILPIAVVGRLLQLIEADRDVRESCLWKRIRRVQRWALWFVVLGYLWPPIVRTGGLAWLVAVGSASLPDSQAGLLFLMGSLGVLICFFTLFSPNVIPRRADGAIHEESIPWDRMAWLLGTIAISFLGAHLLSWTWPFRAPVMALSWKLALLTASTITLAIGVRQVDRTLARRACRAFLLNSLPEGAKLVGIRDSPFIRSLSPKERLDSWAEVEPSLARPRKWWSALVSTFVLLVPLLAPLSHNAWIMAFGSLSPLTSLMSLTPASLPILRELYLGMRPNLPPWWLGLIVQPCAGVVLYLIGRALGTLPQALKRGSVDERKPNAVLDRVLKRVAERFDSPMLTRELRNSLRNGNLRAMILLGFTPYLLTTAVYSWPLQAKVFGAVGQYLVTGLHPGGLHQGVAPSLALLLIVLGLAAFLPPLGVAVNITSRYTREVNSSSLSFLLTTPLSDRQIAVGFCLDTLFLVLPCHMVILPLVALLTVLAFISYMGVQALSFMLCAYWYAFASMYFCSGLALCIALSVRGTAASMVLSSLTGTTLAIGSFVLWFVVSGRLPGGYWLYPLAVGTALAIAGLLVWQRALNAMRNKRHGDLETEGQHFDN